MRLVRLYSSWFKTEIHMYKTSSTANLLSPVYFNVSPKSSPLWTRCSPQTDPHRITALTSGAMYGPAAPASVAGQDACYTLLQPVAP